MTFLNNLLGEGPLATIVAVALGLLVLVIVLVVIYRLSVGQGLRQAPGARSRQPRLGIVDAFDLDRQRQLVLVRRDNVEHLIMIGGPNDLLIEPAIIRGQPAQAAEPRRDAGASGNGQNGDRVPPRLPSFEGARESDMDEPAVRPASFDAPPPREAPREFQPQMREPVREPMRDTSFAPPPVMAAPPPSPPPQAPVARPPMPSIPTGEGQGPGPSLRPMPPPVRPAPPPPPPRAPAPPPLRPAPPLRQAPPPPPAEPQQAPPPPPVSPPPPPPRQLSAEPAPPPRATVNIDSLEEEMAKLLGRPVDPPNRS